MINVFKKQAPISILKYFWEWKQKQIWISIRAICNVRVVMYDQSRLPKPGLSKF